MKKWVFVFICMVFIASVVSAEIILNQQPNEIYNLGERINIPITVTSSIGIYDFMKTELICDGLLRELPKEEIVLPANEVVKIEKSVLLIKRFTEEVKGTCQIKISFENKPEEYVLSDKFIISDSVIVKLDTTQLEYNPEEKIVLEGTTTRENGVAVNGFVEVTVVAENSENKTFQNTVSNGFFSIDFSMPKETKAGQYFIKINVYEKDPLGEISNTGFLDINILIKQVPTTLEIFFESTEVAPEENVRVKSILHDQTGEKIPGVAIMSIRNSENKTIEQLEKQTDEFFEYLIKYNEKPSEWSVVSISSGLTATTKFKIMENEDVDVEIVNSTLILTNKGNVPYNKTTLVKIGESTLEIYPYLEVDEVKKYSISAPDGEYVLEVLVDGENKISKNALLTGDAINLKEISNNTVITFVQHPIVWIFVIFILGFVSYIIFRRSYRKSYTGYVPGSPKGKINNVVDTMTAMTPLQKNLMIEPKNKAELSFSLKGEKQNSSVICLKIKNYSRINMKDQNIKTFFNEVDEIARENKAALYENQDCVFLIFSPIITKTFKNERKAAEVAEKIKRILEEHNKLYREKINFGISVNVGDIIAKMDKGVLQFMSLGNFITAPKKLSSISDGEIYISEKVKERLISDAKTERHEKDGVVFYTIKEFRIREDHGKFIGNFLRRLESDKKDVKSN